MELKQTHNIDSTNRSGHDHEHKMPSKTVVKKPKPTGITKARPKKSQDATNLKRRASQLLDENAALEEIKNDSSAKSSRSSKSTKTSQGRQKAAASKRSDPNDVVDKPRERLALDALITIADTVKIMQEYVHLNLRLGVENNDVLNNVEDILIDTDSDLTIERSRAHADSTVILDRLREVQIEVADNADSVKDELAATENEIYAKMDLKFEELGKMICERFDTIEARIDGLA